MNLIKGLSFSLSRAVGLSEIKNKVARKTGVPTTRGGLERKIGNSLLRLIKK